MDLYWIRKYAKNIETKETANTRVNVIEMDELYSFVERKNRFYAITLVNRDTREIVGFNIAFDKSRERIQRLVDRSVKANKYYSDAYSAYSEVCYEGAHTSLKNKSQTYTVEDVIIFFLKERVPKLPRIAFLQFKMSNPRFCLNFMLATSIFVGFGGTRLSFIDDML